MGAPLTLALAGGGGALSANGPWVTANQLSTCGADDSVDLNSVCIVASEILFLLSGSKYGIRTETVRPAAGNPVCSFGANAGELILKSPVFAVTAVKVDGVTLPTSQYQLYNNRRLVRLKNAQGNLLSWPTSQRLDIAETEVGTFSVTYQWGRGVPVGGRVAAQVFACQLAKYINNDSDCALPDRMVSVTRQGLSQTIMDPSQFIKEARTGLYLVDTWLGAVNPHGARRRATITGPDSIRSVRAT